MTLLREDPELVLPEPPESVPALPPQGAGLALASPAGPGRVLVEGHAASAVGTERGPIETLRIGGAVRVRNVRAEPGTVVNLAVSPGLLRRERVGPGGTCQEVVLAASTMPLVVVQYQSEAGTLPDSVEFTLSNGGGASRYRADRRGASLVDSDGVGATVRVVPEPESVATSETDEGDLTVSIRPAPGTLLSVVLAAGTADAARRAVAAAKHAGAHARIATEPVPRDGLTLETGVAEIDDAFVWARHRLSTGLAVARPQSSSVWSGLAALAVGDRDAAERALGLCREDRPAHAALLAAGLSTTFGEAKEAAASARALLALVANGGDLGSGGSDATDVSWLRLALGTVREALHNAAPESLIAELAAAETAVTGARDGAPDGGRKLPVVGAAAGPTTAAAWLKGLLAGEPTAPGPDDTGAGIDPEPSAVPGLLRDPGGTGWSTWRELLTGGMTGGPAGPGTWDDPDDEAAVAPVTALVLLSATGGVLGLSPDAHAGRLRLAPRWPPHVVRFNAHGLTVGSARLSLGFERTGNLHRYEFEPTTAAVPPMIVFEARIPGAVTEVRIDGARAKLETRPAGADTFVPVQLPVDAPRTVEIVTR